MSAFPNVLVKAYTMDNSDINVVGCHLGYGWNEVCDAVRSTGFYAEDGDGSFTVHKDKRSEYASGDGSDIINKIFTALFDNNPEVSSIQVVN